MPGRTIHGRHVWTLLASGFVLFIAGCAQEPGGPLCFPTRGRILYDSQPLAEALVVFHPLASEPEGNNHQRPIAVTETDGTFQLSTLGTGDGAPEGDYVITV